MGTTAAGGVVAGFLGISIHVPAMGTTVRTLLGVFHRLSIHVPAMGTTPPRGQERPQDESFQSTCPRRARLHPDGVRRDVPDFNPRARNGHDRHPGGYRTAGGNFNPRARDGHDLAAGCAQSPRLHFNPRARDGHDSRADRSPSGQLSFQSTCPRWARPTHW